MMDTQPAYTDTLAAVTKGFSDVGAVLAKAHQNRTDLIRQYASGFRMRGLNEIFGYLLSAETAYLADTKLSAIVFLPARVKGKLEISLEATLSGMPTVVCDCMRDLMEMELLLDDLLRHR